MAEGLNDCRAERVAEFQHWVRDVRDPAKLHSEGLRVVNVCEGKATAEYEIAQLPSERFALRYALSYNCGNGAGHAAPWTELASRDECVSQFLQAALRHFQADCTASNCSDIQREARRQMLDLLTGTLFGFIEPIPLPPRLRW